MSASPNLPPSSLCACSPQFAAAVQDFQEKRAALLKHIAMSERLAEVRPASRLEVRPRPEMISSGVAEVDAMTGGIPRGCLTEICGGASSGKTSLLLAAMTVATREGETCVLIDASDSFDPASGQAAGVELRRLLWVRCGKPSYVVRRASEASDKLSAGSQMAIRQLSTIGHHPEQDVQAGENFYAHDVRRATHDVAVRTKKQSERRLEQVLRATDLILQSGGFGLIVLDLAGIAEKFVRRIPLASWFRFQRAVEHTKSALLVVSETPCAQTCAALALRVQQSAISDQQSGIPAVKIQPSAVRHQASGKPSNAHLLEGMQVQAEIARSRLERKPVQSVSADFKSQAVRFG